MTEMAKQMTIEEIREILPSDTSDEALAQLEGVAMVERKRTVEDVLIELRDFLKDADAGDRAGMELAIEIITKNF